jgi:hypothetical protein
VGLLDAAFAFSETRLFVCFCFIYHSSNTTSATMDFHGIRGLMHVGGCTGGRIIW